MALSIDRLTNIIDVPQADLTLVTGSLYELDTDAFRLELKSIEDSEEGIIFDDTHLHNTEVTVAGTIFARTVEILSPYSVQFTPDSQYSVRLVGSNNNIFDVENAILVQNQVQLISNNSAGLIKTVSGSGVLPGDITAIAAAVWNELRAGHVTAGTYGDDFEPALHIGVVPSVLGGSFIQLATSADNTAGFYEGCVVQLIAGTGVGQHRPITVYTDQRRATIYPDWKTIPDTSTRYQVRRGRVTTSVWGGTPLGGVNLPNAGNIPVRVQSMNNAVINAAAYTAGGLAAVGGAAWDAPKASHVAAGTFGALAGLLEKLMRNRTVTDPVAGTMTVYDDDNSTILFVTPIWEDAAGTIQYGQKGIDRRDRHT